MLAISLIAFRLGTKAQPRSRGRVDLAGERSLEKKPGWGRRRSGSQPDPAASSHQSLHFLSDKVLHLFQAHFSHL